MLAACCYICLDAYDLLACPAGPWRTAHLSCKLFQHSVLADAMLRAQRAPELGADLVAALANLQADDLARHGAAAGVSSAAVRLGSGQLEVLRQSAVYVPAPDEALPALAALNGFAGLLHRADFERVYDSCFGRARVCLV